MGGPCLLLRHDKAGDAVKSLPAIRALRLAAPELDIHLIVSPHNASIFETEQGVRTYTLPAHWKQLKNSVLEAQLAHQGCPTAFARVINLLCDPFEESDRLLGLFRATEKFSTGPIAPGIEANLLKLPRNSPAGRDETLNVTLLLSQAFGVDLVPFLDKVSRAPYLSPDDQREAQILMGPKKGIWLGFCPFAGLKNRSHPEKRWESFLPQATRVPWVEKLFIFGAPSDCRAMERLRERSYEPQKMQLCFPSSFRTLGAYLLRLDGLVAVDSGPLHLARSLDVRSLGILSGGDAKRWFASLHPQDRLLKRGLFNRFPTSLEMTWAFRRWLPAPT